MSYLTYLKGKFNIAENTALIDNAIKYLGTEYPLSDITLKGYEIIDNWFEEIKLKWNVEVKTLNLTKPTFHGDLEPKSKGFIINLNKNLFTTQRRFVIAHELAHIISFETKSEWPEHAVFHSWSEEHYCNRIARAMLLPKTLIDFTKFDLTNINAEQINYIKYLWPEFKVAPWQILTKLFEDFDSSTLVGILWEYFPKESCLRIIDHYHPKNIFIPKKDRIFLDNLMKKKKTNVSPELAFNTNDIFQGEDIIEIGSLYKKRLLSTTFPIKTKSTTYIIQIIKT